MSTQFVGPASSLARRSWAAPPRLAGRVRRRPSRSRPSLRSIEQLEGLDAELARRASEAGRLRFEMGRGLDSLERSGGDHALGFSSIEAYALERCERSGSWTQKARGLARRLEGLPALAEALISGSIHWSMATILATIARPDDAHLWLAEAGERTVREMKLLVAERKAAEGRGPDTAHAGYATHDGEHPEAEEPMRTLTLTVAREDAWCFEHARLLARHLAEGRSTDAEVMFGLVAESTSTLCGQLPPSAIDLTDDDARDPQRAWEQELTRMRAEAEVRCETSFRRGATAPGTSHVEPLAWPDAPEAIDRQLRELAHELVAREVAYGRTIEAFFAADGWRRLGYASAGQYARERLGCSLSSLKNKRHLSKRLRQLTFLASALEQGQLGFEAARLVAGVATRATVEAWVERAKQRTLKHLREDIDVAQLLARWSEATSVLPPSADDVERVHDMERAVVTGQVGAPPSAPAATPPSAKVTLRLRVSASTARDFRHLEAIYLRHRGTDHRDTSFLRFACNLFTDTWRPPPSQVAYAPIYARDRHRCQSPCCTRRDVTPHHLRFRSRGGDDSPENVTSLCTWCHLEGIHLSQMSAEPPASHVRWTLGRNTHTIVEGRNRIRS